LRSQLHLFVVGMNDCRSSGVIETNIPDLQFAIIFET
jgi:hypothetical protein